MSFVNLNSIIHVFCSRILETLLWTRKRYTFTCWLSNIPRYLYYWTKLILVVATCSVNNNVIIIICNSVNQYSIQHMLLDILLLCHLNVNVYLYKISYNDNFNITSSTQLHTYKQNYFIECIQCFFLETSYNNPLWLM